MKKAEISTVILSALLFLILFTPFIQGYFSQDDFFHLRQILGKGITDIPSMFLPTNDLGYAFYRPLSREFYSFVMFNLFNLSPLPYHLVNTFLIFVNALLLYKVSRALSDNKLASLFAVVVYLANSVHSIELAYLSSSQLLFATCFAMLGLLNYQRFLVGQNRKYGIFSFVFFVLAICSHESSVAFIPLIILLELCNTKFLNVVFLKKLFIRLLPFFVALGARAAIFFIVKSLPSETVYQPAFSIKAIFNSFGWYILWSIGFPEILVDFVGHNFSLNPNFIKWYGYYAKIAIPLLSLLMIFLAFAIFKFKDLLMRQKAAFFYAIAFMISISPFLFFPQHKFVYYLSFPIIWLSAMIGLILSLLWKNGRISQVIVALFIGIFLFTSYLTINLNAITHWSVKRAQAAQVILSDVKQRYPTLLQGAVFYIQNDPTYPVIAKDWGTSSKQAFYILSGSDAFQLLYKDPKIKVYYEDMNKLPKNINQNNVISYIARFPY